MKSSAVAREMMFLTVEPEMTACMVKKAMTLIYLRKDMELIQYMTTLVQTVLRYMVFRQLSLLPTEQTGMI